MNYTHRIVTANRPNTEETGDYNGALCSQHKSEAAAEKALGRLVAMGRDRKTRADWKIEPIV